MKQSNATKTLELSDIKFVKTIPVGSVNPNNLLSDDFRDVQTDLLNRCLNDYPKGVILGKDITIGRFMMGEHEIIMQKTTYHVGFSRKPEWLKDF